MRGVLHLTSGDCAGGILAASGVPGEILVWHDVVYDGPRRPGWPDEEILAARARFLHEVTGGGLGEREILSTLRDQYARLAAAGEHERIVLWFDACLFDQAMLAHALACLGERAVPRAELICVDAFPGVVPFHGLGQLNPPQMASLYDRRRAVTEAEFEYARLVDRAFAEQDLELLAALARSSSAPLPWVPAAAARWLQEQPDPETGLGRLEQLALEAVRSGRETPSDVFAAVAAADAAPRYWGDTTLWAKINALADRTPPLVRIEGPAARLPQWEGIADLKRFRITGC